MTQNSTAISKKIVISSQEGISYGFRHPRPACAEFDEANSGIVATPQQAPPKFNLKALFRELIS
jgi:hypothetical protein